MMVIVELDFGNSNLKWRCRQERVIHSRGCAESMAALQCSLEGDLGSLRPDAVWVSSVVPKMDASFVQWCHSHWSIDPCFFAVSRKCASVENAYKDVSQMGVDRWLGMLAAFNDCNNACVVVDLGTAMTVDLIASTGQHLGGYIVPGIDLMIQALSDRSEKINLIKGELDRSFCLGMSTSQAVYSGVVEMSGNLVVSAIENLATLEKKSVDLFMAGGGVRSLNLWMEGEKRQLTFKKYLETLHVCPDLIFDGMQYAKCRDEVC